MARRRSEKGWSSDGLAQFRENVSRQGTLHILVLQERTFKEENWEFGGNREARWHTAPADWRHVSPSILNMEKVGPEKQRACSWKAIMVRRGAKQALWGGGPKLLER